MLGCLRREVVLVVLTSNGWAVKSWPMNEKFIHFPIIIILYSRYIKSSFIGQNSSNKIHCKTMSMFTNYKTHLCFMLNYYVVLSFSLALYLSLSSLRLFVNWKLHRMYSSFGNFIFIVERFSEPISFYFFFNYFFFLCFLGN